MSIQKGNTGVRRNIALTANLAMDAKERKDEKDPRVPERIEFKPEWFDADNLDAVPTSSHGKKA